MKKAYIAPRIEALEIAETSILQVSDINNNANLNPVPGGGSGNNRAPERNIWEDTDF